MQAEIWQRKGRQVIDAELAKPAKSITRRGAKDDQKAASTPEEVAEVGVMFYCLIASKFCSLAGPLPRSGPLKVPITHLSLPVI